MLRYGAAGHGFLHLVTDAVGAVIPGDAAHRLPARRDLHVGSHHRLGEAIAVDDLHGLHGAGIERRRHRRWLALVHWHARLSKTGSRLLALHRPLTLILNLRLLRTPRQQCDQCQCGNALLVMCHEPAPG